MKLDINTIITEAYHISRCSPWKLSSKARIAWAFIILVRIQQGEKQKRCHPKSDNRLWQATHFSTKNPINKPAMSKRRLLVAAVFPRYIQWKKTVKNITSWLKTLSASLVKVNNSQDMLHKFYAWTHLSNLNQSEHKIGRGAWPTRDRGKKRSSPPVFQKNWLNFCVWGQFEIKTGIVLGDSDINTTYFI